jgi:Protein of unknown function with HXXEE motif
MLFLRKKWFDIGFVLSILILSFLWLFKVRLYSLTFLLWLNVITLLLHQFEEYRFPGYFPGMLNVVMYKSKQPDRYPLNTQTAFIINVFIGWSIYILAAVFASHAIWLAIASILISVGNIIAHAFLFNIKGRMLYNPGLFTAIFLFLPMSIYFFCFLINNNIATTADFIIGIILGILLNVVGVLKLIDWLKDEKTRYIFEDRQLE